MHVVILAAGLGSRLGAATLATSKAMIEVAGRPLADYAARFAERVGAERIAVVGGYRCEDLERFMRSAHPDAALVENRDYRAGNLLSLVAGLALVPAQSGYLVMNTDHIYRPGIAAVVRDAARQAREVTAFCDFDRPLGPDDMKVALDAERRVAAMSKRLARWDSGYVGMTFVPSGRAEAHRAAVARARSRCGEPAVAEDALVELARTERPPAIADVSGHGWLEIDEPHERALAERVLSAEAWW